MAQHDYNIANQGFPAFRTDLNNALSAIQTTNSGTSRPTGAVAGQLWLDTTSATTPTLKYYDGADDISLATIDHSANTVNWLDSTVSVTGLTTTATGTVLTLSDSATTSTVNLIIDNDKEIRFREATANGTNYISLSAPASLSADVTYTLPVAPTTNNQALISSTAGVMSFTPYSLPASDGTANQILKTNGSGVLSFATPSGGGFSGATTTSSAVDITLTSASTQTQNVSMTALDKSVILPDATTLTTKGAPIYVINNQGLNAFTIKNNVGFILATINFASVVYLTLNENSTASGSWSTSLTNLIIGVTPYTDVITGTTGVGSIGAVAQGNQYYGITASKISSTSAIITYQKGTSQRDVYGVVVSYSGTTITVNSETILYNGSSTSATNANVLMLDSTSGFLFVSRASNSLVVPFTLSGSTITAGTSSSTFGVGTYNDSTSTPLGSAIAMSSTIALLTESNSTTNPTFTFRTVTHNGASAPTIGSSSSAVTTSQNYFAPAMAYINATNAFVAYQTPTLVARVVTISGASAPTLQTANTSATTSPANSCIRAISSTKFNVSNGAESLVYTVSGTTVSYTGSLGYGSVIYSYYNNSIAMFLGEYMISMAYNGTVLYYAVNANDFYYSLGNLTTTKSYYLRAYGSNASGYVVGLDSTTGFAITNNSGTSTISIQLIKIL